MDAAVAIYQKDYYGKVGVARSPGANVVLFDAAVNSGVSRSIRWAESVCGLPLSQSSVPSKTLIEAINAMKPVIFIEKFQNVRMSFLQSLGTFKTFGKGWTARVIRVEKFAKSLL